MTHDKTREIRIFFFVPASFLGSTACCLLHIISKLLHRSFPSGSVIVSLPVLSLRRKIRRNRSRNSGNEQPSSQSRVERFLQILPFCLGPVDAEFSFNLVPVLLQTLLNNRLAITNFVDLRFEKGISCHVNSQKGRSFVFISKVIFRPYEFDICKENKKPFLLEIREILDINSWNRLP